MEAIGSENVFAENLDQNAHEGIPHNNQDQLRNRNHAPRMTTPPEPHAANRDKDNEIVKLYKCCCIVGFSLFVVSCLVIGVLVYLLHQRTMELERCSNTNGYVPQILPPATTSPSLCEKELEKWQRLFQHERNITAEYTSRIVSDADSYSFTKIDLELCKAHYWNAQGALFVTWSVIVCLFASYCYCCCCKRRRYNRYGQQVVVYRQDWSHETIAWRYSLGNKQHQWFFVTQIQLFLLSCTQLHIIVSHYSQTK